MPESDDDVTHIRDCSNGPANPYQKDPVFMNFLLALRCVASQR